MNEPKMGAVASFAVLRANGEMEDCGTYHNIMANGALRQSYLSNREYVSTATFAFKTLSSITTKLLTGTYTVSSGMVYRDTGNVLVNSTSASIVLGDYVKFSSGFEAYVIATPSVSTIQLSLSDYTTSTPEQIVRYKTSVSYSVPPTTAIQTKTVTPTLSYGINTTRATLSTLFTPVLAPIPPYEVNTIFYNAGYDGNSGVYNSSYFDIIPPIYLDTGDSLVIKNFVYNLTWDIGVPRAFSTCLVGLTGTGQLQRALGLNEPEIVRVPNRIWLLDDANKMPLLSGMSHLTYYSGTGSAVTLPLTCIPLETIVARDFNSEMGLIIYPTYYNNTTATTTVFGLAVSGGMVRQIAFGYYDNTRNIVHGIIEYDTAEYIPPFKVITINSTVKASLET